MSKVEIRHFQIFCGLGGGAKGFNRGQARVGALEARFRCIGGVDVDPAAVRDFGAAAGVPGTLLDLFDREQYRDFHGREPEPGWREVVPEDLRRAASGERPHIVFLSAPCKGFSGLLSEQASRAARYQALNSLTARSVLLMLEAWGDDPPELILFENVPRIANRGRPLLDRIGSLLRAAGYAVEETNHDCGELGGLGQSRKRFLLVARHMEKIPPFLYEPVKRPLKGVGEIIGDLPVPGPEPLLPMHRVPSLQWKTWVRLAFVEAGSDWRSLERLRVEGGQIADYGIAPEAGYHRGVLGVKGWNDSSPTVISSSGPTSGAYAIADPRIDGHAKSVQLGVRRWGDPAGVVTGKMFAGGGPHSVSDPRIDGVRFNNIYRVVAWADVSPAVAGPGGAGGGLAVADPRPASSFNGKGKYRVSRFDEAGCTVIAASSTGNGAFAVADPRCNWSPLAHRNKIAVVDWGSRAGTVTGSRAPYGGGLSVADPRPEFTLGGRRNYLSGGHFGVVPWDWSAMALPEPADRLVAVIRALDGTWHRPFTTLELAALQGLVDPEETLELDGMADSAWRERIGNAVPPPAAQAIASEMGRTLLLAWSGETFALGSTPIWVRQIAVGLSVSQAETVP